MKRELIHRDRAVYTCSECVNIIPLRWGLFCPVFGIEVKSDEKACIYRNIKQKKQK